MNEVPGFVYKMKHSDHVTIEITEEGTVLFSHPNIPDDLPTPYIYMFGWAIAVLVAEHPKGLMDMVEKKIKLMERYCSDNNIDIH